jgi:hypothetical protein
MGVNPDIGLTGLATWFWLDGDPTMADATASSGGLTVTVHASLVNATWDFGDDQSSAIGLGRQNQADVQHTFQTDTYGRPNGYAVACWVRYQVSYSVNGGPFTQLGIKSIAYTRSYTVNQLQPQAVSGH